MRPGRQLLLLTLLVGLAGCGSASTPPPAPPPLTVANWKALPVDQKYTPEALDRLKWGDPKLDTPEGWNEFSRTTLAEARQKDFPKGKKP